MRWYPNLNPIVDVDTGQIIPRRGLTWYKVSAFFGKWLPDVLRFTGYASAGAVLLLVGGLITGVLFRDEVFRFGCAAAAGSSDPCDIAEKIRNILPREIPDYAMRPKAMYDLCIKLRKYPDPVGASLAEYAQCPRVVEGQ